MHIPYVDPQGTYSQHGVTFKQNAPSVDWMAQNLAGYDKPVDAAGLHRGSAQGMVNYISADPTKSSQEILQHEQGGHGTVDLLTGIHGTSMDMGAQAQQRFYNRLPLYARQELRASPNPAQTVGENLLDKTPDAAPLWADRLQQDPLYSTMPKPEVGNEILAYTNQYQYPEDQYLRDEPMAESLLPHGPLFDQSPRQSTAR